VSEVVCELPFNYSMADGLLYIARAKDQEVRCRSRRAVMSLFPVFFDPYNS